MNKSKDIYDYNNIIIKFMINIDHLPFIIQTFQLFNLSFIIYITFNLIYFFLIIKIVWKHV